MERYKQPELLRDEKTPLRRRAAEEELRGPEKFAQDTERAARTREIIEAHLKDRAQTTWRRKWTGRGLIVVGAMTVMSSCPLYAFALIGPETIMAGLAMIAGGSALLAWRPRLKDTNEAMVVAMRYGNCLTVPRLALELNVSFERAEQIIQELVRNGIAEIDMDHRDPDHTIVYRIRGL
ncbi:MAG: hypothetical protein HY913_13395 [Desulfomonile tiedjei]|nr:hypothetical protein [Desulfomonile tiedjei]